MTSQDNKTNNIVVFASGEGTTLQYLLDNGKNNFKVSLVISDKNNSGALKRAEENGIETFYIDQKNKTCEQYLYDKLKSKESDFKLIVLAGYISLIPSAVINHFGEKMINTHPSLLPKYGGKGMYGDAVYEAVLSNSERETGITIHFVNKNYDEGVVIAQEKVSVFENDNLDSLKDRMQDAEKPFLLKAIINLLNSKATLY